MRFDLEKSDRCVSDVFSAERGPNEPAPDTGIREKVDQAKAKKEEIKQDAQAEAQDQANQSQARAQNEVDPNNREQQKAVAQEEAGNAKNRALNVLNKHVDTDGRKEQIRGTAQEQKNKTVDYLKEKFPEERQDRFIYRLKSAFRLSYFVYNHELTLLRRGRCRAAAAR